MRGRVGGGELGRDVGEVGKGKLAGVRMVAYTEEADVIFNEIAGALFRYVNILVILSCDSCLSHAMQQ